MHVPPQFDMQDHHRLCDLIRAWPLGLLITAGAEGITANPVPFLLLDDAGGLRLQCHLARSNGQWREIADGADVKVVFSGPNHYISPNWYPSKAEHGRVVPTWNYTSVQASGDVTIHQDKDWLRANVEILSAEHEHKIQTAQRETQKARHVPWSVDDAPDDFISAQLGAITGLEFKNVKLTGKFKLSQNRTPRDREQVQANLRKLGPGAIGVADLMKT